MISKNVAIALTLVSAVAAGPAARRQDPCQDAYKQCIAAGRAEVACSCELTTCSGEDSARIRDFCATATASLARPTTTSTTSIPGGCNPGHPGSCPSSYFSTTVSVAPTTTIAATTKASATTTTAAGATGYASPKPVAGKKWEVQNLSRYCGEGNTGCDYNFAIAADGKTERCTVIRMPGANAATESWSNQPCTDGSKFTVSWGYVSSPAPPFAVLTVVEGKELAWFGVANVNEQKVTPSNPFGSGQYGNITEQVYTY